MKSKHLISFYLSLVCTIIALNQCAESNPTGAEFTEPELLWTLPAWIHRSIPATTPSGTIYIGIEFYNADSLCALGSDGSHIWAHSVGNSIDWSVISSPSVDNDGMIYIGGPDGSLYCIKPDGTLDWQYQTGDRRRPIISSPALGRDGSILFSSMSGYLYCLNADGTHRWQEQTYSWYSTPAIGSDGTIYVGTSWELLALSPSGEQLWIYPTDSFLHYSSPAIDKDGTIYICSYDGTVYAINPNGTEKWHYSSEIRSSSSPIITETGQILFTCNGWNESEGHVGYIGSLSRTGELLWTFDTPGGYAPVVGLDGIIYVGADSTMFALNDEGRELWSFKADHTITNSPVLCSDGILYFAAGNALYAFQTGSHGLASSPWPKLYADYLNTSRSR